MDLSRILALAGPGSERGWRTNLRWFRLILLIHMAARSYLTIPSGADAGFGERLLRWAIVLVALVGCIPGYGSWAARLAAFPLWATRVASVLLLVEIAITVPFTANHVFLEFLCLALLSVLDERDEREAELLLPAFRWLVGIFFFYTGLQKVLYGYYFDGQFLAYLAGTEDRFATVLGLIIPAEELAARLQRLIGQIADPELKSELEHCRETAFFLFDTFRRIREKHEDLIGSLTADSLVMKATEFSRRLETSLHERRLPVQVSSVSPLPYRLALSPQAVITVLATLADLAVAICGQPSQIAISCPELDAAVEGEETRLCFQITSNQAWRGIEGQEAISSVAIRSRIRSSAICSRARSCAR